MDRVFLLIVIAAIIGAGVLAGGAALFGGDDWSPRAYVPADGDCFVPPQGDPLYDEHYGEINKNNCTAFKTQSEAKNIDAYTRSLNVRTDAEVFAQRATIAAFVGVIIFLVFLGVGIARGR